MAITGRTHVGPYRVVRQIRAGRSCQVWACVDSASNQRVALKVPKAEVRKSREQIRLLRHEFQVGRDFVHPNVIRIIEFNVVEGIPYLALEFFGSRNLKQQINEGIIEIEPGIPEIIRFAAEGVGYFHQQGWIHRDLKPDNLMLGNGAMIKLIDFSLAKRMKKGLGRLLSPRGKVQGTRSYMSPEQIRGEALDLRTDIYSFGCTLFELLSRRPPYTAESANELLNKHLKSPVPALVVVRDNVTEGFSELVARCMAKRRQERPNSIEEFLAEYQNIQVYEHPPEPLTRS